MSLQNVDHVIQSGTAQLQRINHLGAGDARRIVLATLLKSALSGSLKLAQ
jgi:hypothetical protein